MLEARTQGINMRDFSLIPWVLMGIVALGAESGFAQNITLDGSLGPASTLQGPVYNIEQALGTTVQENLFHSFSQLNLESGEVAVFESAANIQNILSRITGGSLSSIDGILATNSPAVNLFLINPSGLIFGPNARLNIGGPTRGSFIATTVDGLIWPDGNRFDAIEVQASQPLLTLRGSPSGFTASQRPIPSIEIDGSFLVVPSDQSLLFLGGEIEAVNSALFVDFPVGGRIELAGVSEAGMVPLQVEGNDWSLSLPEGLERANIRLNRTTIAVDAEGDNNLSLYGGDIELSDRTRLLGGIPPRLGSPTTQAGNLIINAQGSVSIQGAGSIVANNVGTDGFGQGGDIIITAGDVQITDGARLSASLLGRGESGDISIVTNSPSTLEGTGQVLLQGTGTVAFGNVGPQAMGPGGNISIDAFTVELGEGAQLVTNTAGVGDAGNVSITAKNQVLLQGTTEDGNFSSGIFSNNIGGVGRGGNVIVEAPVIEVLGGAQLVTATAGLGNAGNVHIQASDRITLDGTTANGERSSAIFSNNDTPNPQSNTGEGGPIRIVTSQLTLSHGAVIDARTVNDQRGGEISLTVDRLNLLSGGQILTTSDGSGSAGDINITATEQIRIAGIDPTYAARFSQFGPAVATTSENSALSVQSTETGSTGNILINTPTLILDAEGQIIGDSNAVTGGNLFFDLSQALVLSNESLISATAGRSQGAGDGGNININTPFLISFPDNNSDIIANAFSGSGGDISIRADAILNFQINDEPQIEQLRQNQTNDISASSQFGSSGVLDLAGLDIDPSQGTTELPSDLLPPADQISRRCAGDRAIPGQSQFFITGSGGLLPRPSDLPVTPYPTGQVQAIPSIIRKATSVASKAIAIAEAKNWSYNRLGQVQLIAGDAPALPSIRCTDQQG